MSTKTEIVVYRASYRQVFSGSFRRKSFSTATGVSTQISNYFDSLHNEAFVSNRKMSEKSGFYRQSLCRTNNQIMLPSHASKNTPRTCSLGSKCSATSPKIGGPPRCHPIFKMRK